MHKFVLLLIIMNVFYVSYARRVYFVRMTNPLVTTSNSKIHRKNILQNLEDAVVRQHDAVLNYLLAKESISLSTERAPVKLYSYTKILNAFSVVMSERQAKKIMKHPKVFSVRVERKFNRDSEGNYKFLGMNTPAVGAWSKTNGSNTIIGLIDDGIWPEGPSFKDTGYGAIPSKWKGTCQPGKNFTQKHCNKKLVGARYFSKGFLATSDMSYFPANFPDYASARGMWGHGSHTASIAAGSLVPDATISKVSFGKLVGISFGSRIAMYKACWGDGENGFCAESDVVAAIDSAVKDGVDVISVSISGASGKYSDDVVAQASFNAVQLGIPCVFSAGNSGDSGFGTVRNTAPWVLTVAASSTDQRFESKVTLGSGVSFKGYGFTNGLSKSAKNYSLIYAQSASVANPPLFNSSSCVPGSLSPAKVKGKIVFCETDSTYSILNQSKTILDAGGVGMITYLTQSIYDTKIFTHVPTALVSYEDGKFIRKYILLSKNTTSLTAMIYPTNMTFGSEKEAPVMAGFSSKGPNYASNYILKPDITAPGVDILGAYSQSTTQLNLPNGEKPPFALLSGTSMACPHVAGVVALIKALNPSWPPSWIYSAIITTGYTTTNKQGFIRDADGYPATPFNMGGGHINVTAAMNPGLVFGIDSQGYKDFQCTPSGGFLSGCSKKIIREIDLNLPSLSLYDLKNTTQVIRKMTLVGNPSTYIASVRAPAGSRVTVNPKALKFRKVGETRAFTITVKPIKSIYDVSVDYQLSDFTFGSITWKNERQSVKMNIAVNIVEVDR